MSRSIKTDYLLRDQPLADFHSYNPCNPNYLQIIQDRSKYPCKRELLLQVLLNQHQFLPNNQKTVQKIYQLGHNDTFTVTTGQQPALFGGPLYTIYKTISAIAWAKQLQQQFPDYQFVPIFWIASEDHDFAEINHTYFDYKSPLIYESVFKGAVGRHLIDNQILNLTKNIPLIQDFYKPNTTWTEAFRKWMHYLFADEGLVLLDADNPYFKETFAPIMEQELVEQKSYSLIQETSRELISREYHAQLKPQPINLFYLDENSRNKIEYKDNQYFIDKINLIYTQKQILTEHKNHPERFSPNAALRPVFQEVILPNIAYISGWAEIAYWLQLKPVFQHYNVFYPLLLPRLSTTLMSQNQADTFIKAKLEPSDILKTIPELRKRIAHNLNYPYLNTTESTNNQIQTLLNQLSGELEKLEPGLAFSTRALLIKNFKFLNHIHLKVEKALVNRYPSHFKPIFDIKNNIQPENFIQERTLNLLSFCNFSDPNSVKDFIKQLFQLSQPTDFQHKLIIYNG